MEYQRSQELQERMNKYIKNHTLTEDIETLVDNEKVEITDQDTANTTPEIGPELGISDLLISAINDEWNTISMYNNMIAQLTSEGYLDMVDVIQDIVSEENVHVGQLQKALETISSNTNDIAKGEQEAEEQLTDGEV